MCILILFFSLDTSFAQNFEDKNWYNFDDSHVSKVDVNDVKTTAAYLLFYRRRRPLNEDPTRTVEEIVKEAQEKQRAAELKEQQDQKIVEFSSNHNIVAGYSSSENEQEEDQVEMNHQEPAQPLETIIADTPASPFETEQQDQEDADSDKPSDL